MSARPKYYILKDKEPVPAEMLEWAAFFEDIDQRMIARDDLGEVLISTVFLGLDHSYSDEGPPLLFETMVFNTKKGEEDMYRYSSWDEAVAMHNKLVERYSVEKFVTGEIKTNIDQEDEK